MLKQILIIATVTLLPQPATLAGIIYYPQTVQLNGIGANTGLDLDNVPQSRFAIRFHTNEHLQVFNISNTQFLHEPLAYQGDPVHFAAKLNAGYEIGPSNFYDNTSGVYLDIDTAFAGRDLTAPPGPWQGGATGYVGLVLTNNNLATRYGWLHLTFDDSANSLSVHGFAWETEIGKSILAGDTGVTAVPEPSSCWLLVLAASGATALRFRSRLVASQSA